VLAAPDDIRLVNVFCETGHGRELVGSSDTHIGGGSGSTRESARAAAIGEAVERYSASFCGGSSVLATADEIGERAVDPARFALFAEEQYRQPGFRYARFTRRTRIAWARGWSLPAGRPAALPAQLVYLAWRRRPGEAAIGCATSNGLACRATRDEAVLTGLLELMERDAFMITWGARLSWPRLTWQGNTVLEAFERRVLAPTGLRCAALDLSAFWNVPCVLGVARSDASDEAPVGVGAAAAPTIERAIAKALDEAVRVRSWARSLRARDPAGAELPASAAAIRSFDDHIRWYAYDGNAERTRFLDTSDETRHVDDVEPVSPAIGELCDRLAARGASAYAVDVTAPDVRDAGLHVVKVVAPELCALDVEHAARLLGGRRRYDEPIRLGRRDRPLTYSAINPDPHPFP
jgi:ribosomal protein S12 methylthiotransferase accessory factor